MHSAHNTQRSINGTMGFEVNWTSADGWRCQENAPITTGNDILKAHGWVSRER